ncbi:fumarylacetoacetate hydrolase family protein [Novosphingobium pentaromativorans]|uniref:Fumarylacetoacetase-like C-terminal domain-containing protein n=1 Tax=Novosphingobium pentaromativorans US6-1 TaxID=1088721 RepID=G6EGE2_9SPHN|nr:fumarylacetoacetate hydrolase family protein [Novosphingobium pentaromativorans]EHJ59593.1 hypothetical protein NSU_3476 [Novosphingobium pentaromativorans US6-1]
MKLALFNDYCPGLVVGDRIVDLSAAVGEAIMAELPRDRMPEIIARFAELRPAIEACSDQPGQALEQVRLRAPLPRPRKMFFGLGNYKEFLELPDKPVKPINMFVKSSRSVIDPGATIHLIPHEAIQFQHEGELAVVIGSRARNVSPQEALNHVFGYTCVVDASARGFRENVTFINKSADTFCPLGPWIVTADDLPDPQATRLRLWVDGQLRQDYPTSDMENPVREIVSYASRVLPLEPGDVLACGVNHQGLGPLQDGERGVIEIDGIGRLEFAVADPLKRKWPVGVDQKLAAGARTYRRGEMLPPGTPMFESRIG